MIRKPAISSYQSTGASEALFATPHRLIQMLMGGALDNIAKAKGNIQQNQPEERHKTIVWIMTVVDALRGALDFEQGGELAVNLDRLYDYMNRRLISADIYNDPEPLTEVASLLAEIKSAWDAMPDSLRHAKDIREAVKNM